MPNWCAGKLIAKWDSFIREHVPCEHMRILITNDDGIEAPGVRALEHIANEVSKDVCVVAPETDNSGASHSLTLAEPLRMRRLSERHFAVKGTPTDCVIMGVRFLMKDHPPDLIMCGITKVKTSPTMLVIRERSLAPLRGPYLASHRYQ